MNSKLRTSRRPLWAVAAMLCLNLSLSSRAQSITNGLAVYLNFDSNIVAQAGTTNAGSAMGGLGVPVYTSGLVGGGAALFNNDGNATSPSDWAVSLGNIEWIYSNSWSFSLWVNAPQNSDNALFGNKDWSSGGNTGWVFADTSKFLNYKCSGAARYDLGGKSIVDGNWHHVAAIFNRATNWVSVYVDGNLTAATNLAAIGSETLTPTTFTPNVTLVGASGGGAYSGAGAVDDLGVWSRPLTANEINSIYAQGLKGQPLTTASGAGTAPVITSQPQSETRYAGFQAGLSVSASGSLPLSYQWYLNNSAVTGATNSSLVLSPLSANEAGNYTVVVSNSFGSITNTTPANIAVLPLTSVASGLVVYLNFDSNIVAQAATTNSGVATGNSGVPVFTNGVIGGAAALFNNDGSGGSPSDWAVSLGDIEWIYSNSWSVSLWVNSSVNNDGALFGNKDWNSGGNVGWLLDPSRASFLNYTASGAARHDIGGKNLLDGQWHHVAAIFDRDTNGVIVYVDGNVTAAAALGTAGSESLTPASFAPNATLVGGSGNGNYSGTGAIDDLGIWSRPLTPAEVLSIYAQGLKGQPLTTASETAGIPPLITSLPQSESRYAGLVAGFSVAASGTAPLRYQWYFNNIVLTNATNSTLVLNPVPANGGGNFTVAVSNPYGSVTSSPAAFLTVLPLSNITSGLVVYLNLESNILAQAGTTNSGVPFGASGVPVYTNGILPGGAARFSNDGQDTSPIDWAASVGNVEFVYSNSWSFSLWVQSYPADNNDGALFGNKDWTSGGDIGWVFDPSRADFLNYTCIGGSRFDIGSAHLQDGNWHHVAAIFTRDTNGVTVYVDGNINATAKLAVTGAESLTPANSPGFPANATLVGGSGNGLWSGAGAVNDLGIWQRPLTPGEVLSIYAQGLAGKPLTTASENAVLAPTITSAPASQTWFSGFPATFSVTASGTQPLSYQWYQNGSPLAGQTNATLSFLAATNQSGDSYTVVVGNRFGSITNTPPAILMVQPGATSITNGLVVYLNFETNILGQAGTTNDAVPIGAVGVPDFTTGIVGKYAALFQNNGNASPPPSDWAASLGDVEWIYTNDWSFSLWVKTTDMNPGITGNKDWNSGGNIGWVLGTTYVNFLNYNAVASPRHDIGNFDWRDGQWHHIAAVFYRDVNMVFTYVDGAPTAQAPLSATGWDSLTPANIIPNATLIGSSGNGSWSTSAAVDDYGIWIRPLTPVEVSHIHQAGLAGRDLTQADLVLTAPALTAAFTNGTFVLSYPTLPNAGRAVQTATNLVSAVWTAVTNIPATSGANSVITLPPSGSVRFFRLQ